MPRFKRECIENYSRQNKKTIEGQSKGIHLSTILAIIVVR